MCACVCEGYKKRMSACLSVCVRKKNIYKKNCENGFVFACEWCLLMVPGVLVAEGGNKVPGGFYLLIKPVRYFG